VKILVTGGAGFIGSWFVEYFLNFHPAGEVTTLDKLTYAGNLKNLAGVMGDPRHTFIQGDVCDPTAVEKAMKGVSAVVHFAAESHVDRSVKDSGVFLRTNVVGTGVLLEAARRAGISKFVHVSTDEVYGSIDSGLATEESALHPNSPYSASKAGSDLLALSYFTTHGLPVVVTRCSNNFGPRQFPEKLMSLFITNAIDNAPLPVYGDGLYKRDWIYVEDHCAAVELILRDGRPGETYNVGGEKDRTNLEITDLILEKLGKPKSLKTFVKDRPGHDRRYAVDSSKIERELGWKSRHGFEDALGRTIAWYAGNEAWWRPAKAGVRRTR
jgi:dTDP-glucose 4,6-dehydratase